MTQIQPRSAMLKSSGFSGKEVGLGESPYHVFIFKPYKNANKTYKAFCSGTIISVDRVLSSANCFLTNQKRFPLSKVSHKICHLSLVSGSDNGDLNMYYANFANKRKLEFVRIVAGIVHTLTTEDTDPDEQWRSIEKIFSQRFYRYPAYNLAVLAVNKPWIFDNFVKAIPFATMNQNFDGTCKVTSVKPTQSWSSDKYAYDETLYLWTQRDCEKTLLINTRLYYCTNHVTSSPYIYPEVEGSGLICHGTGDPAEENINVGILVGVITCLNIDLPSLHTRVGLFSEWVANKSCTEARFTTIIKISFLCVLIDKIILI